MELGPESPELRGYNSDGEASLAPAPKPTEKRRRLGAYRTRRFYEESGQQFSPTELSATRQYKQRPRSGTDPLAPVPEDRVLTREQSLSWDEFGEQASFLLPHPLENTRRWSTDTLFSVPVANSSNLDEDSGSEDYLSPTGEDQIPVAQVMAPVDDAAAGGPALRRKVRKIIMEIEDDVLPFADKTVTADCLTNLCNLATRLKKDLQEAHLDLEEDEEYRLTLAAKAVERRQQMVAFLVSADEQRLELDKEERSRRQREKAAMPEKRPTAMRKVKEAGTELAKLEAAYVAITSLDPECDAELFEKMERLRVIDSQYNAANSDSKEAGKLAMECNLVDEGADLDGAMKAAKDARAYANDKVLDWRKAAGIWADKKRSSNRSDLKMPTFEASMTAKGTIYDFEREWKEYATAMEYSKEEAVKMLKVAVQPPSRNDILGCQREDEVFSYLRKHHGNPMVLLNAREKEVRGWGQCKGTDMQQRDWLILAKSKLESTLKLCQEHGIERYLHFSSVAAEIQSKFPPELTKDFKLVLKKHLSPSGVLDKEKIIELLLEFLEDKIQDCTLGVNLDIVNYLGSSRDPTPSDPVKNGNSKPPWQRGAHHYAQDGDGNGKKNQRRGAGGQQAFQVDDLCLGCGQHHTHLFYCEVFAAAMPSDRFNMVKAQQACARCLGMRVKLVGKRDDWHPRHEKYCKTKFACEEGQCSGKPIKSQFHITLCRNHLSQNKNRESEFINSLDPAKMPPGTLQSGIRFLLLRVPAYSQVSNGSAASGPTMVLSGGHQVEVLPDVTDPAVFMMQKLPVEGDPSQHLLAFYDSGCNGAGVSDRGCRLLDTTMVRPGPTVLDVAGGRSLEIPYGDEQFTLKLDGGKQLATVTALHMPNITSKFPEFRLQEAWDELQNAVTSSNLPIKLPTIDEKIGGEKVDLLIGIKYLKYYPVLVFSLPSGLAVYRAKLQSASGRQAVLGGPHSAWAWAIERAGHMNPRAFLTQEARAWCVEAAWVNLNRGLLLTDQEEMQQEQQESCICTTVQDVFCKAASKRQAMDTWRTEEVGTDSPYRCVECRKCQQCKKGDQLEEISFREEAEQALIETSIELDVQKKELRAYLPFVEDPTVALTPNRFIAEKVFRTQLDLFKRKPDMREDTLRSHGKLVLKGHVKREKDLSREEQAAMSAVPGPGYFIPWRIVHNEGSLSTPCRMVFDASSKTPGGNSLNGVLAKGQNRLVKLQSLLANFRLGKSAMSADISMAYNGTKLQPAHFKFQRYLWKEDLKEGNETEVMCVVTLIYGVKSSGGQCQASIEKLADQFGGQKEYEDAVTILKKEVYVDDVMASRNSKEECKLAASGIEKILAAGSMSVKAFTHSGEAPLDAVSADGTHVGLGGYLWRPEQDLILVDVGPPRLGKAKRGKLPEPITGDFGEALKRNFTRRTLAGLVARVFDPLGLATPVTANFKLDVHDLCKRKLDWDDPVPLELLEVWAANMVAIQDLKEVVFRRAAIPVDAVSDKVDLLVAVDASQYIGVAAIYARVEKQDGSFSCQLVMARSKIMADLTIPRAELKSAVMGAISAQVIKRNLAACLGKVTYVTDSTVCLHWIHQDDRPLQVAVRNAVIEVRRFSERREWFHVESQLNIADLGTRSVEVQEIGFGSEWQDGKSWMRLPYEEMPIKSAEEVTLSAEEKRAAAAEMRAKDIRGHQINLAQSKVTERYVCSRYLLDPCRFSWSKVLRVMALVIKFVDTLRKATSNRKASGVEVILGRAPVAQNTGACSILEPGEVKKAEDYFFRLASLEVKKFAKLAAYRDCSEEKEGILYFTGRLLDSHDVCAMEKVMFDLNPASFCKPVVDRHSPVAYSIMTETHWRTVNHFNASCTFRESLSVAYILGGRDLAQEVRNSCVFCRRFRARLQEVEMGKVHATRLTIAPAFTVCQVDLLGPYKAQCEHNHRSSVKVWGVVFKDPASGAVFVHAMGKCDTSAFLQAYTRFAARFCHPQKLYPDEGSQLLRACQEMEISWVDVATTLNAQYCVGVEFQACPVGGHNFHGMVERSVREVKKLFNTVYAGIKLDLLGYETAFGWISNELNNLPLCLGTRYRDLDHLDLLTPNRLIHGRANRRALSGCCMVDKPSVMLARMEDVFQAWWRTWYEEKLADFVMKPAKWTRSDRNLREGDIVIFQKSGEEQVLGQPIWRIGRVVEAEVSPEDYLVRAVLIEYKNAQESVYRTTRRAARQVAVLHSEDDLEIVQELNMAARKADQLLLSMSGYVDQQEAVMKEVVRCPGCCPPCMCNRHGLYFTARPYLQLSEGCYGSFSYGGTDGENCESETCQVLSLHEDPWSG